MRPPSSLLPAHPPVRRALGAAAAGLLLLATVTGCGDDSSGEAGSGPSASSSSSPSDSTPAGPTLEVTVAGDHVTPVAQEVDLEVGEKLTIDVQSDRAGELHVHSDPEHTFDFKSGTSQFHVSLTTPGSVDIEEHVADALVARVLVR